MTRDGLGWRPPPLPDDPAERRKIGVRLVIRRRVIPVCLVTNGSEHIIVPESSMVAPTPPDQPHGSILCDTELAERSWERRCARVQQFPLVATVGACVVPQKTVKPCLVGTGDTPPVATLPTVMGCPILVFLESDT